VNHDCLEENKKNKKRKMKRKMKHRIGREEQNRVGRGMGLVR